MIELLLTMAVVMLIFWLMIIRPAKRRESEQSQMVASLAAGQKVMMTSGLLGVVTDVTDKRVLLEISPGVVVEIVPRAVGRVIPEEPVAPQVDQIEPPRAAAPSQVDLRPDGQQPVTPPADEPPSIQPGA